MGKIEIFSTNSKTVFLLITTVYFLLKEKMENKIIKSLLIMVVLVFFLTFFNFFGYNILTQSIIKCRPIIELAAFIYCVTLFKWLQSIHFLLSFIGYITAINLDPEINLLRQLKPFLYLTRLAKIYITAFLSFCWAIIQWLGVCLMKYNLNFTPYNGLETLRLIFSLEFQYHFSYIVVFLICFINLLDCLIINQFAKPQKTPKKIKSNQKTLNKPKKSKNPRKKTKSPLFDLSPWAGIEYMP